MDTGLANDPHSERGSYCPRNLFGYTDYRLLQAVESVFTEKRALQLEDLGVTGNFDASHLRSIHSFLFQDVFPWAGELRVVNIAKGNSRFGQAQHVVSALDELLAKLLAENHLRALSSTQFIARAAYYLGELNAIHPFREGNGRTQREFIRQLALQAEHPLSWAGFTQVEMVAASIASHEFGDYSSLIRIITRALLSARERDAP